MQLILATHNEHKCTELREILAGEGLDLDLRSLRDLGFDEEIIEDGQSFYENARIKAQTVARNFPGAWVLADDSGLEVDCLGGRPGIYSARYQGENTAYPQKWARLMEEVEAAGTNRRAQFRCVIVCLGPEGQEIQAEGRLCGEIAREARGTEGFGYDPIFYLPELGLTAAELSPEEKNRRSHRGMALRLFAQRLRQELSQAGLS